MSMRADYRLLAPQCRTRPPTQEHFLPLLVALGATTKGDGSAGHSGDITYGVLFNGVLCLGLE